MALDVGEKDNDDSADEELQGVMRNGHRDKASDEDDEEEEEEEEPRLKYASLTKSQASVYRNGDATSAFIVAGDKMVCC